MAGRFRPFALLPPLRHGRQRPRFSPLEARAWRGPEHPHGLGVERIFDGHVHRNSHGATVMHHRAASLLGYLRGSPAAEAMAIVTCRRWVRTPARLRERDRS